MGGFTSFYVLYLLAVVRTSVLRYELLHQVHQAARRCLRGDNCYSPSASSQVPALSIAVIHLFWVRSLLVFKGDQTHARVCVCVCACAFASQLQFSDPTPTKATLEIWSGKNFRSFNRLLFVLVHSAALHPWGWTDRCPGVRSRTARNQRANRLVMISNETTTPFDIVFSACLLFTFQKERPQKTPLALR